jgi:hypothetical protein
MTTNTKGRDLKLGEMNGGFFFVPSECDACGKHVSTREGLTDVMMSCPDPDIDLFCYVCSDCIDEIAAPNSFRKIWAASSAMLRQKLIVVRFE